MTALEDQRDFLLRSLDDLEREHDRGRRRRRRLRDAEGRLHGPGRARSGRSSSREARAAAAASGRPRRRSWRRLVLTGVGVAAFALLTGVLVAQARGRRDALTGDIRQTTRVKLDRALSLASQGHYDEAIAVYDHVLADQPDNVEAMTFKGWFQLQSGDGQGVVTLIDAVEVDPDYPATHAFLAVAFEKLGRADTARDEIARLDALDPPPQYVALTGPLRTAARPAGGAGPDDGPDERGPARGASARGRHVQRALDQWPSSSVTIQVQPLGHSSGSRNRVPLAWRVRSISGMTSPWLHSTTVEPRARSSAASSAAASPPALGQAAVGADLHAQARAQRLQRLDAADGLLSQPVEYRDPLGLLAALAGERAEVVDVVVPCGPMAGVRVPDDEEPHGRCIMPERPPIRSLSARRSARTRGRASRSRSMSPSVVDHPTERRRLWWASTPIASSTGDGSQRLDAQALPEWAATPARSRPSTTAWGSIPSTPRHTMWGARSSGSP